MARLGPALAMLAAMYGGNTEPEEPMLAYPWWALALLTAAVFGSIVAEHRGTKPLLWAATSHLAAIATVGLAFHHLWRLLALTGGAS